MLASVLTVTARDISLKHISSALKKQKLGAGDKLEWVVVDAHYPAKRKELEAVRSWFRIRYVPMPDSWARGLQMRFLCNARNESLRMAGVRAMSNVLTLGLDDDCAPRGQRYVAEFIEAYRKRNALVVPGIFYMRPKDDPRGSGIRMFPSGNALMAVPLEDALDLNGYDELFDANWPSAGTYEDIDMAFRLKSWYELEFREDVVCSHLTLDVGMGYTLRGIKCNHTLRVAGSFITWDVNVGRPSQPMKKIITKCPYLHRENCQFLGRKCEIPLKLARRGHKLLPAFFKSRPAHDMVSQWKRRLQDRQAYTLWDPYDEVDMTVTLEEARTPACG